MNKVLEVIELEKKYKNGRGVFNINFELFSGKVLGLLGPNGSGKTTIMKNITGLMSPDKGKIYICSKNTDEDFEQAIANVGCLIETPSLMEYMSAYNNLKIVSRFYSQMKISRIDEVLNIVGLYKHKNEKVKNFSLGMKQRLGIAIAIYQSPKLIILDEPGNGLDIEGTFELRNIITTLAKEFMSGILISSHLIREIEVLCDDVLIIKDGKIIDRCDVKDIASTKNGLENHFMETVKIAK